MNKIIPDILRWKKKNRYYYKLILELLKKKIPENRSVLEIGCGIGDILSALKPKSGAGIDKERNLIEYAGKTYPGIDFHIMPAENIKLRNRYDFIIMSDLLVYVDDIDTVLNEAKKVLARDSMIVITNTSPVWAPIFAILEKLKLKKPTDMKNIVPHYTLINILKLQDFDVVEEGPFIFFPRYIPLFSAIINSLAPKIPILRSLCAGRYIIAKLSSKPQVNKNYSVSVVVPCHNEEDNVESCMKRTPVMGKFTEIIFVDDGSTDSTAERVNKLAKKYSNPNKFIRLISYKPNMGKGKAVKKGFDSAQGDILMILDADLAVPPEELPKFFSVLNGNKGEFVNGTRLVYPMEKMAMRTLNLFGNWMFRVILSWIMDEYITDTLCGTKVLLKKDYKKISMDKCPWGDFDLLFGASKLKLKFIEVPVHYKSRIAGLSKMKAYQHGLKLLKMCFRGLFEVKLAGLFHR